MDESMTNYAEYRVEKKSTSKDFWKRILIGFAWFMLPMMFIIVGLSSTSLTWAVYFFPIGVIIAVPFGRHNVKATFKEYEYALVAGVMRFDIIDGTMKRKEWFEAKLGDMNMIAPYEGDYKTKADAVTADIRYEAISSFASPDVYFGTYRNEEGKQCIVFFEATNKLLSLAKFYNRGIVIKQVRF
jgi:hypothetical protein